MAKQINESPRTRFERLASKWIGVVKAHGEVGVHKWDLAKQLGLSPQQYYLNGPMVEATNSDLVEYRKAEGRWFYIGKK